MDQVSLIELLCEDTLSGQGLRSGNDFNEELERAFGEGLHIRKPFGAAGAQSDRTLGRT
jgi:hypothetical protein